MFELLQPQVGGSILAREVHQGQLWAARPLRLLALDTDLLIAHLPQGSTWLRPVKPDGAVHRIPRAPWRLVESRWPFDTVWFVPAGEPFAIHTMRPGPTGALRGWYVNVQEPVRVTARGFDYLDHTLDVVVDPDLGSWELKDEDELEIGCAEGLYDREATARIRAAAEAGLTYLRAHQRHLSRWSDAGRGYRGAPLRLPDDVVATSDDSGA